MKEQIHKRTTIESVTVTTVRREDGQPVICEVCKRELDNLDGKRREREQDLLTPVIDQPETRDISAPASRKWSI